MAEHNIEKLHFQALKADGSNYPSWSQDMQRLLKAKGIEKWILEGPHHLDLDDATEMEMKHYHSATFEIWRHIDLVHKQTNRDTDNPAVLWSNLKMIFGEVHEARRPIIKKQWDNLKISDFKNVAEYMAELGRIVSDMIDVGGLVNECSNQGRIDKTISSMPSYAHLYQSQLRALEFTDAQKLFHRLLIDEAYNRNQGLNLFGRPLGDETISSLLAAKDTAPNLAESLYTGPVRRGNSRYPQRERPFERSRQDDICKRCKKRGHTAEFCFTSIDKIEGLLKHRAEIFKTKRPPSENQMQNRDDQSNIRKVPQFKQSSNHIELDPRIFGSIDDTHRSTESNMIMDHTYETSSTVSNTSVLVDNGTTASIFRDPKVFRKLNNFTKAHSLNTLGGSVALCTGYGPVRISIGNTIILEIPLALHAPEGSRNILAEKDIIANGFGTFADKSGLTIFNLRDRAIMYKIARRNHLYECPFEVYNVQSHLLEEIEEPSQPTQIWHRRLGHPAISTLHKMNQHNFLGTKGLNEDEIKHLHCTTCDISTADKRHVPSTIPQNYDILGRLDVDIIGPIQPPSLEFKYILAVTDYRSRYTMIALLKSRNQAYGQIILLLFKFQAVYPHNRTQTIRIDGAAEFRSSTFKDFTDAVGIGVEYSPPYVHEYNGVAEAYNKKLMRVTRGLLLQTSLPLTCWSWAVQHAATILSYWPHTFLSYSTPYESFYGHIPKLDHLKTFGCKVLVPVPKHNRNKIGPQRKDCIYLGFTSSHVIRFIDPNNGYNSLARYEDCKFDESVYPKMASVAKYNTISTDITIVENDNNDIPRTELIEPYIKKIFELKRLAYLQPIDMVNNVLESQRNAETTPNQGETKTGSSSKKGDHISKNVASATETVASATEIPNDADTTALENIRKRKRMPLPSYEYR